MAALNTGQSPGGCADVPPISGLGVGSANHFISISRQLPAVCANLVPLPALESHSPEYCSHPPNIPSTVPSPHTCPRCVECHLCCHHPEPGTVSHKPKILPWYDQPLGSPSSTLNTAAVTSHLRDHGGPPLCTHCHLTGPQPETPLPPFSHTKATHSDLAWVSRPPGSPPGFPD